MTLEEMKRKIITDRELVTEASYLEREKEITIIDGLATVIVGARRAGKTSYMKKYAADLIAQGIPPEKICYLSFFTSADTDFPFSLIEDAYYGLYPEYSRDNDVWFFFDEIQSIRGWGGGVAYLMESHPCHVMISGSSAKMLSVDIANELRGRCIPERMYPLSFHEFLDFNQISHERKPVYSDNERNILAKQFRLYMERGSYPLLCNIENKETRRIILNSYFDLTFSRDIIERYDISKSSMLRFLMRRLVKNSGSPYTIRKLIHSLESAGYKATIPVVSSYISMMTDSCFLSEVSIYGTESKKEHNPRKLYAVDHQMAVLFREFSSSSGIILEHIIYSVLQRYSKLNICYYRSEKGYETDFILSDEDSVPHYLIQVTDDWSVSREREIRGIAAAIEETGLANGIIITMDNEEIIETGKWKIQVIPAWKFALNAPDIFS